MEPRLGRSLADVRIHTDSRAAESARDVDAAAYTVGRDVVFGAGRYNPGMQSGRSLLAHELTHVVQQSQGQAGGTRGHSDSLLEQEADQVAAAAIRGGAPQRVQGVADISLARSPEEPDADDVEDVDLEPEEEDEEIEERHRHERSFLGLGAVDKRFTRPPGPQTSTPPSAAASAPPADGPPLVVSGAPAPRSPFMPPEEAHDFLTAQRGFEHSTGVSQFENERNRIKAIDDKYGPEPDDARIKELEAERRALLDELGERRKPTKSTKTSQAPASKEKKPKGPRPPDTPEQAEKRKRLSAVRNEIEERAARRAAKGRLARSVPGGAGAPSGTPQQTHAILEIVDASGRLIKRIASTNRPSRATDPEEYRNREKGVHAEEDIILQLRKWAAKNPEEAKRVLAGARIQVVADQEVCGSHCQPALRKFATDFGIDEVRGVSVHPVNPEALQKPQIEPGDLRSAKAAAVNVTSKQGTPRDQLAVREEVITSKDSKSVGKVAVRPIAPRDSTTHDDPTPPPKRTTPAGQPEGSHPPRTSPTATSVMAKADMGLSAVRDFQRYKEEYKKELMAQGLSEKDAEFQASAKAAARAGITLAANLRGGKGAAGVNFANAFLNAEKSGQSKVEAAVTGTGTVAGGLIANRVAPSGPVGTAIQLLNTGAQVVGAPQQVQDITYGAAELVPSSIVSTTITAGARSWHQLGVAAVTGDAKGIDKLGKEMEAGGMGPWLQGYAQVTGIIADVASGDDFSKALDKAGKAGKGSWASRIAGEGNQKGLADYAFDLGQSKEALAGKYGPVVGGYAVMLNMAATMARGESFEKAWKDAARDTKEGQKIVAGQLRESSNRFKAKVAAKVTVVKETVKAEVAEVKSAVTGVVEKAKAEVTAKLDHVTAVAQAKYQATEAALTTAYNDSKATVSKYWKKLW